MPILNEKELKKVFSSLDKKKDVSSGDALKKDTKLEKSNKKPVEVNPCTGCKYEIKGNRRACVTCIHGGLKEK